MMQGPLKFWGWAVGGEKGFKGSSKFNLRAANKMTPGNRSFLCRFSFPVVWGGGPAKVTDAGEDSGGGAAVSYPSIVEFIFLERVAQMVKTTSRRDRNREDIGEKALGVLLIDLKRKTAHMKLLKG